MSQRDICLREIPGPERDIRVFVWAHVDFSVRKQGICLREIDVCVAANVTYIHVCVHSAYVHEPV